MPKLMIDTIMLRKLPTSVGRPLRYLCNRPEEVEKAPYTSSTEIIICCKKTKDLSDPLHRYSFPQPLAYQEEKLQHPARGVNSLKRAVKGFAEDVRNLPHGEQSTVHRHYSEQWFSKSVQKKTIDDAKSTETYGAREVTNV
jgi:hypothetical protein